MTHNTSPNDAKTETLRLLAEIADGIAALRAEVQRLTSVIEPACQTTAGLAKRLEKIEAVLASQPSESGANTPATIYRDFHADTILLSYDDAGNPSYKIKGTPFTKFGVRVWPETLPSLGINPVSLKPGPNPIAIDVRAVLNPETGKPRKITGLAPATHIIPVSN